jgi:DNA-binding transcriptional MerR regulator
MRRVSGHRKYTRSDLDLIFQIKELLYTKKFTIAGAKKYLLGLKKKIVTNADDKEQVNLHREITQTNQSLNLTTIKSELEEILNILK